ncbi:MAG: type 2 lantipeptide synthetase LanM family protein [Chroococcidiopsidaceae cyanobacterium CP_BM_ER_R8_30]|nr:type 2 lantipeptide synthetase LanM family protein [Chroococcidiopsidaceae cyanobacterium CP_BM_ER_R8_30]
MTTNSTKPGMTTAQLRHLVAQASTLYERLDTSTFLPASEPINESLLQSRLDAWCDAVTKGDRARFHQTLSWDGLSLEQAKQALMPVKLRADVPLPDWAVLLRDVLELAPSTFPVLPGTYRFLPADEPMPFEEIFMPFVLVAQQRLVAQVGDCLQRLTDRSQALLERSLLGHLVDIASDTIDLTFRTWRTHQQSSFSRLLSSLQRQPGNSLYLQFVQEMLQDELIAFFQAYPVLGRLLATQTLHWIEANAEFLQYLDADWEAITTTFAAGQELGQVVEVKPALSDPHRGGRTVLSLKIEPHLWLIYKPKPLGIEAAYNQLLSWLNDRGCPLPLKVLKVLHREHYAWVECAELLPCQDTGQLERFYQRAGMLLCLLYVLQATDCYYENVLASGEHLVFIDTETLMQPCLAAESGEQVQTAQGMALQQMGNSVLRTALLPAWDKIDQSSNAFDFSGLGSYENWNLIYKGLQWYQINTDQMTLQLQEITIPCPKSNAPTLNGKTAYLGEWINTIIAGFEQMYQFLLEQREALLTADSPLWQMEHQPTRIVFRRTNTYVKLTKRLRLPEFLRDGIDRSIGLELLKRWIIAEENKPPFWSIIRAERQQMEQLDVPCFTVAANSSVVKLPDCQVEGFLSKPGFQAMLDCIRLLGEADLKFQSQLIRASLGLRTISGHGTTNTESAGEQGVAEQQDKREFNHLELNQEVLMQEAIAIAQRLQDQATDAPDGSVTWIAPQFSVQDERFYLQPTGNGLYDGRLGIALFLAALEQVTQAGTYRDLCLRSLQESRQRLEQPATYQDAQIGMAMGVGGMIYSLTQIGQFLDDDTLIADALKAVKFFPADLIRQDRQFDIISGAAGYLLGLLKLYRVSQDAGVLQSAIMCGQHLLSESTPMVQGIAWKTLNGRPLTGLSHGTAGIAYALLYLAQVSGQSEFRTAALDAIAYEQSLFIPVAGNWPDLRDFSNIIQRSNLQDTDPIEMPLMSSWCHGAMGIGLSRLGGLEWFANDNVHHDIQVAIQTTKRFLSLTGAVEQLCCGKMGQIELLITASARLQQPELLTDAWFHASQVLLQSQQRGGYKLEHALPASIYAPGFFRGEAGIGYTLLRLVTLEGLPSVLLFD